MKKTIFRIIEGDRIHVKEGKSARPPRGWPMRGLRVQTKA